MMNLILDNYWSPSVRFAVFLCAFAWLVQIVGVNIAANMIAFGADSSMLFPSYVNMRRGQFIIETLAWVVCPWKILASAAKFLAFLGGYTIFLGPMTSILICE